MCMCLNYRPPDLQPEDVRKLVHQAAIRSGLVKPEASQAEAVSTVMALLDDVKVILAQKGLSISSPQTENERKP